MPRIARAIVVGVPHHLTQRGNHRQDVFFIQEDRQFYLQWLAEYAHKYQVRIWAYCLMTNHIHLVLTPEQECSLASTMRALHSRYTQRQNFIHQWAGHLWQGRYFSTALDEAYFWHAIRYVERNPVRADLVERAEDYSYSSAAGHCGLIHDPLLEPLPAETMIGPAGWSGWLAGEDGDELFALRASTASGRPCGSVSFLARLASMLGRPLHAKPRGRPRKSGSTIAEEGML
ncbi:MAG TPA: transposase [Armatimonadota bacterium]|jgi:putative transposase